MQKNFLNFREAFAFCVAIFFVAVIFFGIFPANVSGQTENHDWRDAMDGALAWLASNEPSVGSEWAVIALARANVSADDAWFEKYLSDLKNETENLTNWTDFQRVTLALSALGKNAGDFFENNFLAQFENFVAPENRPPHSQDVNADIFALLALNSRPYAGTQPQFVESILAAQHQNGAWAWGDWASADITAMAIQALAPYYENSAVAAAIDNAFAWIETENPDSAEDFSQIIIALTSLDFCAKDFVAQLLNFYDEKTGGFISPWT
ncbi:MAG: hypothetical protein FWD19_02475, partial [Defluviitaleaceae bacterium]|nr:hypothetical protein [Defluviitaleaceae bacterium]